MTDIIQESQENQLFYIATKSRDGKLTGSKLFKNNNKDWQWK